MVVGDGPRIFTPLHSVIPSHRLPVLPDSGQERGHAGDRLGTSLSVVTSESAAAEGQTSRLRPVS